MLIDPLSDVLTLLRPQSAISIGIDLAGDWAFHFSGHESIKFNAVTRGLCWVNVAGGAWHRIEQNGCFLLTQGLPFTLASDPTVPPMDASALYQDVTGPIATWNEGGDMYLIGGCFIFAERDSAALLGALPPIIAVDARSPHASVLQWALAQLAVELDQHRPGGALMSDHLAHFMLVHILRLHLETADERHPSWLHALADRQISSALTAIHGDPARAWALADLAAQAGMSRSVFAERFRAGVGLSAMDYLTRWRMLLARDRLRHTADSIASIALSVGYQSEAAFSTAFKRANHGSPRQFRRETAQGRSI